VAAKSGLANQPSPTANQPSRQCLAKATASHPNRPRASQRLNIKTNMSKRIIEIVLAAIVALFLGQIKTLAQPANGDPPPPCIETGPTYGEWEKDKCPELNNSPTVSPTTLYGNVGQEPCMPTTIIAPTFDAGSKHRVISYNCPCPSSAPNACPTSETAPIKFDVSPVGWEDPLPSKWTSEGSFVHTAYVDVTGGDPLCPPPGRYPFGSVTWVVGGKWNDLGTLDVGAIKSAIQTAINGVKAAATVAPCDVGDLKLNGEIRLWRRSVYCSCYNSTTRMESKLDPSKVTLTLKEIECPVPTLCLPPLKLGKLGQAALGLYATFSADLSAEVKPQVAIGCQSDTLCGQVDGGIEAGFKVKGKACWENPKIGADCSGSATASIAVNFSCCHHGPGSFSIHIQPLKLAYKAEVFVVGWKKEIAKGEKQVFKGGDLGPYNFNCPI
jgi:hypothetical protein